MGREQIHGNSASLGHRRNACKLPRRSAMTNETFQSDGFSFGRSTVVPRRRELSYDRAVVELGDRAFELLLALIDARGEAISKDRLMMLVRPGRIVEKTHLKARFRFCVALSAMIEAGYAPLPAEAINLSACSTTRRVSSFHLSCHCTNCRPSSVCIHARCS
jgi:hypothetical protein